MIGSKTILTGEEWDLVYLLPPVAFKIWWFHYRCEVLDRESWPGEDTICQMLGIEDRKTLFIHRKWLKDHGWLVQTSRAYRGHNPTFRVERGWIPNRGCQRHERPIDGCLVCKANQPEECVPKNGTQSNAYRQMRTEKWDADVSGSTVIGSSSDSSSDLGYRVALVVSDASTPQGDHEVENRETVEPKPKPVASSGVGKTCWMHGLAIPCSDCRGRKPARVRDTSKDTLNKYSH